MAWGGKYPGNALAVVAVREVYTSLNSDSVSANIGPQYKSLLAYSMYLHWSYCWRSCALILMAQVYLSISGYTNDLILVRFNHSLLWHITFPCQFKGFASL